MFLEVPEDFLAAPGSSRPARSIGEVRFHIQIDYISQKPLQSNVVDTFQSKNPQKDKK